MIGDGMVVAMDYTLTDDAGEVLDSSEGRGPLHYLHGHGNIIPGLESELVGLTAGAEKQVTVEAADGYGERHEGMIQEVPKDMLGGIPDLQVGMQLAAQTDQGQTSVTITAIAEETVTVDGNHPLAGQRLHFAVTIVELRDATPVELEHGHVHGPGGHEH